MDNMGIVSSDAVPLTMMIHEFKEFYTMADPQKNNFPALMRRARWDRLGAVLVIFIVLIVLIVLAAKSCGKKEDTAPADTTSIIETVPDVTEAATTAPVVDRSKAIYLSPSTQEDNLYACDETVNEEQVMFKIANSVRALLEADGYTVYMCEDTDNVKNKVNKGNELGCAAYVSLHSNSNVNEVGGEGTECYYNSNISGSRALAENIYNRVAELTPTDDRGLKDETQRDLYEILNNRYPCALIEVEFHDSEEGSQWILDNQDALAKAIKDGIVAFLKNKEASAAPVDETDTTASDSDSAADAGDAE